MGYTECPGAIVMNTDLQRAFNKAKVGIMSQHKSVFISHILFSLKHAWNKSVPTAGTNGYDLLVNPDYFMSLTPKARIGLLAHEAWHPAFEHMVRGLGLDPERWNRAGDYVINIMLQDQGYELPPNGCVDSQYRNMHTKQVYDLLPPTPEGGGGYDCDILPPGEGDSKKKEGLKDHLDNIIVRAATQAKMSGEDFGNLPGEIAVVIDKLLHPKLPWQALLQNFVSGFAKDDFTWKRPNRRFFPNHFLPSLYSEALTEVAGALDASGSVTDNDIRMFLSEMGGIKDILNPKLFTIIDFDTKINNVHHLNETDDVASIKITGRGGTRLQPVFDFYKDKNPTVLIVFSDLHCARIEEDPGYPVIWIVTNNPNATVKFGKMIHVNTRN